MNPENQPTAAALGLLRKRLTTAQRVVVLTGAGVSAESGVPTFRGEDGLWRQYRAVDLATPEAFARDPGLVWEFYNWRRELLAPLRPNPAHQALVELERRIPQFTLITQNIDGLHQQAGSRHMVELHGNIWWVRCTACQTLSEDRRVPLPALPACPACGGLLRPHVVWFGELLEPAVVEEAYAAINQCQLMLVIGTSALVHPAASMGLHARRQGAFVAEINLEPTPNSTLFDLSLLGRAGEIVPQLLTIGH
jgi:NAD-dependent deacetylase